MVSASLKALQNAFSQSSHLGHRDPSHQDPFGTHTAGSEKTLKAGGGAPPSPRKESSPPSRGREWTRTHQFLAVLMPKALGDVQRCLS